MPSFQLATTFLGQPCGWGPTHGVNPEMQVRLQAADATVRAMYDALAPEVSFSEWCGVFGPHPCWRANAKHHSAGAAIDISPATNLYIVTRNGDVPGGEPGADDWVDMRNRALAVYDRAMRFSNSAAVAADVSPRRTNETTQSVWARLKAVSEALANYISVTIDPAAAEVTRVAIENADEISDDELLATIPEGERLPLAAAADQTQYLRILRDYEAVRIPMVIGSPSLAPARTRNPARGFMTLRCEIATALCDQGLRWGACDFAVAADGSSHNGATMHFDLADDGGYPEVHSLLRFG